MLDAPKRTTLCQVISAIRKFRVWVASVDGLWQRCVWNAKRILQIELCQLRWFGEVTRMSQNRRARQVLVIYLRESVSEVNQRPGGVTTSPTLLGRVLVWSQRNNQKFLKTVRYFETSYRVDVPTTFPRGKMGTKINKSIYTCRSIYNSNSIIPVALQPIYQFSLTGA